MIIKIVFGHWKIENIQETKNFVGVCHEEIFNYFAYTVYLLVIAILSVISSNCDLTWKPSTGFICSSQGLQFLRNFYQQLPKPTIEDWIKLKLWHSIAVCVYFANNKAANNVGHLYLTLEENVNGDISFYFIFGPLQFHDQRKCSGPRISVLWSEGITWPIFKTIVLKSLTIL